MSKRTKLLLVVATGLLGAIFVARKTWDARIAEERARQASAELDAAKQALAPRVRERLAMVQHAIATARESAPIETPLPRPRTPPKLTKKNTSVVGSGQNAPFEGRIGVDPAKLEDGSFDVDEARATLGIEHVIVLVSRKHQDAGLSTNYAPGFDSFDPGFNVVDAYLFDVSGTDAVTRGGFRFRGQNSPALSGRAVGNRRRRADGRENLTMEDVARADLETNTRLAFAETLREYVPGAEWW